MRGRESSLLSLFFSFFVLCFSPNERCGSKKKKRVPGALPGRMRRQSVVPASGSVAPALSELNVLMRSRTNALPMAVVPGGRAQR